MLHHASYQADKSQVVIKGIQSYLQATSRISHTQKSEYTYLHVLNKNADNKETILEALSWLHHEFDVGNSIQHLVVTGDAKTYTHLINLKCEYGEALRWLVAFPGDFHTLRNYQEVLMKAYWDAGLKQLAAASGFRGETLTSLSKCSNYSITTSFLFEVWEALYTCMLTTFLKQECADQQTAS